MAFTSVHIGIIIISGEFRVLKHRVEIVKQRKNIMVGLKYSHGMPITTQTSPQYVNIVKPCMAMTDCDLHMSCQSGQALSPTASDSQQQSIAEGLTDDSRDTTDVTNCVQE